MTISAIYPICLLMPEWENTIPIDGDSVSPSTKNEDTWVKLLHLPHEYSCDEAKLLCQESSETWIAWIPNYGEIILHRSCFS